MPSFTLCISQDALGYNRSYGKELKTFQKTSSANVFLYTSFSAVAWIVTADQREVQEKGVADASLWQVLDLLLEQTEK